MATENNNPIDEIEPIDPIPEGSETTTPVVPLPSDTEIVEYLELEAESKFIAVPKEGVVYGYVQNDDSGVERVSLNIDYKFGNATLRIVKSKNGSHETVIDDRSISSNSQISFETEDNCTYCIQFFGTGALEIRLTGYYTIPIIPDEPEVPTDGAILNPRKLYRGGKLFIIKEELS